MRYEHSEDYLYHHGILGQKWGHKNGPPYPLDSSDHSTSEKKAGWRKSVSDKSKTTTESKSAKDMSDEELKEAVNRLNLEQQYSDLKRNSNVIVRGSKYVATAATVVGSVVTLYNNSDKLIKIGKKAVNKLKK